MKPRSAITPFLEALDEGFDRHSWHGPNLHGALRGLTAVQAVRRPRPGRHNIAEIAVHAAYWKYVVRRMITGGKRGSFPLKGSNWFVRNEADATQWRLDLELLADEHRQLRAVVAALPPSRLTDRSAKKKYTIAGLIRGIAAHDVYHAGQIQLLKRLVR